MATVNRGILDGFFGKVGTVVGSFWKGIPVMRAYVRRVRDRKNESQQLVRARFITLGELSSAFLAALRLGFLNEAARNRVTESNIFVKKNWEAVQAATPDSVSIDYTALVVAKGPLHGVQFSAPQFDNPQQVSVVFDPNDELPMVDDNDDIYSANRFQLGMVEGLNLTYKRWNAGIGYVLDFMPLDKSDLYDVTNTGGSLVVRVGYEF